MKMHAMIVALAPVLSVGTVTAAHAAPFSASTFLCGGGQAEKDLLVLKKGQVFDLTDVTIANGNASGRLVAVVQGTWPPQSAAPSQLVAQVLPGSTFTQQFKTPIVYRTAGAVKARTSCGGENLDQGKQRRPVLGFGGHNASRA